MTTPHSPHPTSAKAKLPAPAAILTVVLAYAVFSALWILFSDKAVQLIFDDPAQMIMASTLKGWLFVGVTSMLLYGLMRRLSSPADAEPEPVVSLRPLALPLTLIIIAIVALTAGGMVHSVNEQKDKEVARLQAIADLKTRQISDWLNERRGDAVFAQGSQAWSEFYYRWRDTGDIASREQLQSRLDRFRKTNAFQSILLLDELGKPLWDTQGASFSIVTSLRNAARLAATDNKVILLDPYRDQSDRLHMDFVVPLPPANGRSAPVVVLRVDPAAYLFPALQTWPVPSASGETLLFRRDGDQVQFLNELRHRSDTAMKLRVPVTEKKLLAAQVVRGEVKLGNLVEGVDYRQVPVMGVVRAIPDTDWFLVAKLDLTEVYSKAISDILLIALAGLLSLFTTITGAILFRQRQELVFSLRESQVQAEKLRALQLLDAIAAGSTDAIFVKDLQGRYLLYNQAATRFAGKSADEVLGQDDTALFPPDQAAFVMANDRQVMTEDRIISVQEKLNTVDGQIVFLGTKGPIHDSGGKVVGMFGISRDITERLQAEQSLRESEEMYRSLFENMLNGLAYCRMLFDNGQPRDFVYLKVNEAFERLTGLKDVTGKMVTEVIPGIREADPELFEIFGRVAMSGRSERFEVFVEAMQMWFWISVYCPHPEHFVAVFDVITERKKAETALRESEAILASSQSIAHMGSWRLILKTGELTWSAETYRIYGLAKGTPINRERFFAYIHPEDKARVLEAQNMGLSGGPYDIEYRILVGDRVKWVRSQGELGMDAAGQTVVAFGAVQDITERKRAEEEQERLQAQLLQAQKMESVGRLAGGVAHDFNNMLSVIIGCTELAQMNDNMPAEIETHLEQIKTAAKRSADLTRQLLAFARKQAIAPKVLDLNDSTAGSCAGSSARTSSWHGSPVHICGRSRSTPPRSTRYSRTRRSMPAMPSPEWARSPSRRKISFSTSPLVRALRTLSPESLSCWPCATTGAA